MVSPRELAAALGLHPPTAEQAAVIAAPAEPALVVAGAGAGKTETMAARVVWLVANRYVTPERVLGLTFTRKAARQLADRVRARLRRLAGSPLLDRVDPSGELRAQVLAGEPTVLTYHAYAGRLVAEHGLRLPVEPGARLLSETATWQLAHRVVSTWTEDLDTDLVPATVTGYVLALAGEMAEHLVTPDRLREHAVAFCAAVEEAPRAKGQRGELKQDLRKVLATQRLRLALLPLLESYAQRKRREGAMDFADQMALAAQLADEHPEVVASERERYGAVLLDEYQDTGHAQRVLLRGLFGRGRPMPVTAVGDPAQAIYGWRGASAANLPRFATDFPGRRGGERVPATRYGLLTSFRNPPEVLVLANAVSAPLRSDGVEVDELRPRDDAGPGDVRCALLSDRRTELEWMASAVAARWKSTVDETGRPPTAAVLVRRRQDMADVAAALREHGLPVEVVGLGGLLDEPEVRDLVSALRMLVDPLAGSAAVRLLTGSRWRLGAADLAALWARAGELAGGSRPGQSDVDDPLVALTEAVPGEHAERAGLVDALDDPGPAERYSAEGHRRIRRLGRELAALRRRLDQPLPELVADVERSLLLDIEALSRPGGVGRAQLDAFADVVAEYTAASPAATLPAFLDYLATAEQAEDGLEPGEVEVAEDRVQVLTVHAAKGLEWEVVAVPNLVAGVFPGTKKESSWLRTVAQLPAELRGDASDLPTLRLEECANRKEIEEAFVRHEKAFDERRLLEERRLLYVALTRAERALLVSGHWWGPKGRRGPSGFLKEIHEVLTTTPGVGVVEHWADEPADDEQNPLTEQVRSVRWPVDPLGPRRAAVAEGAELVRAALAQSTVDDEALFTVDELDGAGAGDPGEDDPEGWARDVTVLLEERRAAADRREQVTLPAQLSVSQLVELAADPDALARRLRRPLPFPPNPFARRGTAFHTWLEQRFSASRLLDLDELPGAADADTAPDEHLAALQEAFLASQWAERTPHDVEVAFETEIDGIAVRGRMDAVFADPDGGWTVVDWKTGALPDETRLPAVSVQLAAYRLAWSALSGAPLDRVRAAFHYVRHDRTLRPADLLDADGLRALLRSVPRN
ncbi:ATP-dependent helicase [Streptoalloteichus tenebrarius]|uniref:ATP-dependent helicase n=1 Tax=Streptoalloteichus tenebrarius (strain ATCC 17920 / DSM 40477 / JCM 4838 / CBS 697.72 / NBRC 16177 / NCIMB 11028 / NRRL B-12390 / A12253. 1 / ISP 5477) TaxID=1933 RepID=UPI0020A587AB|nr:UvrD-helicase domain-containing protein [Streptoalloteichus tenebrarius]